MYVLYLGKEIKIHEHSWLFRLPILNSFEAITLRGLFFKNKMIESIVKHELVHINQIVEHGRVGFYLKYVGYFIKNFFTWFSWMKAYRMIPFEVEAYLKSESITKYEIVN